MKEIVEQYREWKLEHDEDYCYDEIHNFLSGLSRGEMYEIMKYLDNLLP